MKAIKNKNNFKWSVTLLLLLGAVTIAYASQTYDELKSEYDKSENVYYYKQSAKITDGDNNGIKKSGELNEAKKFKELVEKWNETIRGAKTQTFYFPSEENRAQAERISADTSEAQAFAQELLIDEISLDLLAALVLYKNPMILSAQKKWKAAVERFSQIDNLDLIMQDYVSFTNSLATKIGPQKNKSMVQMKFPFPGMLSLKGEIVTKDVLIEKLNYENVQIKVLTMLKSVYYNLIYVNKKEDITRKTLWLLHDLEKVAEIKYETGKTSFNDVIKVQIKMEKLRDNLKTIREKETELVVKISQLLDLPPTIELGMPEELKISFSRSLAELYKMGDETNRELMILDEKIKRMALMIDMAEKKFYPDFTAGYSYYQDNKAMQLGTQAMMGSFMTTPMASQEKNSWYAKNDAYIREVKEKLSAMIEMRNAKSNELTADIKNIHFKIDTAVRADKLYESDLIPKANVALGVAKIGYETGDVSFLDVLDADMMWLRFNIEYYKAIRDEATSIANMERLIGRSLNAAN